MALARRTPRYRRLSESPLWTAQRRFYERAGVHAWGTAIVPHHVTSNVALATAYARIVEGFLRDTGGRAPLHIVELGAGPGRFAFLFLRVLPANAPVRYVMTDVAPAMIGFWKRHPGLSPFVRSGRLDFARFDADRDEALHLEHAGVTIDARSPVPRLVVIANYVFSTLRQDAFALDHGRISEWHVASSADGALRWRPGPRLSTTDPLFREYARSKASGRVLRPVGALRCLERFTELSPDALLVLAADRGTATAAEAITHAPDLGAARYGALSFPVSFHALASWVANYGGVSMRPRHTPRHIHVAAFLLGTGGWRATRRAHATAMAHGGPDALYHARRALSIATAPPMRALVSLMERSGPDPRVVAECLRPLWPHLFDADAGLLRELRDIARAAWPNYYHLGEPHDVVFDLGVLLYAARAYADARAVLTASLKLYGDDAATWWNLGLVAVALGRPQEAKRAFRRARTLAPDLHPAGPATVKLGRQPRRGGGR